MNHWRTWSALVLALTLAGAASAQERDEIALERVVARALIAAMPQTQYESWGFRWDAVGSRLATHVNWNLASPDQYAYNPPQDHHRRMGWISTDFAQVGIAACGAGEEVEAFAFRFGRHDRSAELVAALRAEGATVEQRGARYVVTAPERVPAELSMSEACTSPNSAAAQRCWTNAEFLLKPAARAIGCAMPGRG